MPGVIENQDPGEGGLVSFVTTVTSSTDHPVPKLDVELFVDRLRFMGLDQGLVAEADRRLRADPGDGMRWVEERLRALEPPRKPSYNQNLWMHHLIEGAAYLPR